MNRWVFGEPESIVDVKQGSSQYDNMEFSEGFACDAIYRKTINEEYQNNLLIAALPPAMDAHRINRVFRRDIPEYNSEEMCEPDYIRKQRLLRLRKLRVPLCFDASLADQIHSILVTSYSARYPYVNSKSDISTYIDGKEDIQHIKMLGTSADPTNECFSLTGFTGCGKSTAISQCLSYYPPLIRHKTKYGVFQQIPIIHVSSFSNSNLHQFAHAAFTAIERKLGLDRVYSKMIHRGMSLSQEFELLERLVELYSIGLILIDEIQLMDFTSNKANSFEELLSLMNNTKVAIGIIGTEDARAKILKSPRIARRFQHDIRADDYCQDRTYFSAVVKDVWHYQWFDQPVPLTNELTNALCDSTKCVMSQLICLLMYMNYDYLCHRKRPIIDGKYVAKVMHRYFGSMEEVLKHIGEPDGDKVLNVEMAHLYNAMDENADRAKQEEKKKEFERRDQKKIDTDRNMKENVVSAVYDLTKVSIEEIEKAYDYFYDTAKAKDRKEEYLNCLTTQYILNEILPMKKNIKKNSEKLQNYIFG